MVAKQKHFLDSLKQIVSKTADNTCPNCAKPYEGEICLDCQPNAQEPDRNNIQMTGTAYLVDLVSNHKIKIQTPLCKVGRDESNDIVVSGDQSISRHHLIIGIENNQYFVEDTKSRHGTFLNGNQIKERESINDGDVVKVGVSLFWFVIEADTGNEEEAGTRTNVFAEPTFVPEQAHVNVRTDMQAEPSDPNTSTMNEIPVMPNEQSLLERLRMKTRSFDQSGLFAHQKSQPHSPSHENLPSTNSIDNNMQPNSVPSTEQSLSTDNYSPDPDHPRTLSAGLQTEPGPAVASAPESTPEEHPVAKSDHEKTLRMEVNVPDSNIRGSIIYDQIMSVDLAGLTGKQAQLKQQIDESQQQMEQLTNQLNMLRALGINLINSSGRQLVEACSAVFSQLGWLVSPNQQNNQELLLKYNDLLSVVRIIWSKEEPQRSDLGHLSISQTQHWCNEGQEPKGILVISRLVADGTKTVSNLTPADYESKLSIYATKRNVCIMTSLQVFALYRELMLENADINKLRETIINCSGWLQGFTIKTPQ